MYRLPKIELIYTEPMRQSSLLEREDAQFTTVCKNKTFSVEWPSKEIISIGARCMGENYLKTLKVDMLKEILEKIATRFNNEEVILKIMPLRVDFDETAGIYHLSLTVIILDFSFFER